MSVSIPWLVRPDGTVGRGAYAAVGLVLFAVKHNIDRFVASLVFHRPWSILLFFAPVLNLAFFLLLSLAPPRPAAAAAGARRPALLARIVPESALGSAALAVAVVVVLGLGAVLLSVTAFREYGWGLFVGLPFAVGLASAVLHGYNRPRSYGGCVGVALATSSSAGARGRRRPPRCSPPSCCSCRC